MHLLWRMFAPFALMLSRESSKYWLDTMKKARVDTAMQTPISLPEVKVPQRLLAFAHGEKGLHFFMLLIGSNDKAVALVPPSDSMTDPARDLSDFNWLNTEDSELLTAPSIGQRMPETIAQVTDGRNNRRGVSIAVISDDALMSFHPLNLTNISRPGTLTEVRIVSELMKQHTARAVEEEKEKKKKRKSVGEPTVPHPTQRQAAAATGAGGAGGAGGAAAAGVGVSIIKDNHNHSETHASWQ
jgi:hypothetical protein